MAAPHARLLPNSKTAASGTEDVRNSGRRHDANCHQKRNRASSPTEYTYSLINRLAWSLIWMASWSFYLRVCNCSQKQSNRLKGGFRFNSVFHHHYNLQRNSLCMSMNPVRPRVWRGFSLLLADFATHRRARFASFTPVFPLSFSTPSGRANGQVRKGIPCKINNLRMSATLDLFLSIGRHRKNSERKNSVKSAQQAVFCLHAPWRRHRQHHGAAPANTAAWRWPNRTAPPPRARFRRGSPPECPEPRSSSCPCGSRSCGRSFPGRRIRPSCGLPRPRSAAATDGHGPAPPATPSAHFCPSAWQKCPVAQPPAAVRCSVECGSE